MSDHLHKRDHLVSHEALPVAVQDTKLTPKQSKALPKEDRRAFAILILLYLLQGVPVGLAFGSIPFILKGKLLYSQVGVFSLAAYPYSLKLLWLPVVDSIYSKRIGRRLSWIIPVQALSGVILWILGGSIDHLLLDPEHHLSKITFYFFTLVFFCATQDIAVDGWALTCLSPHALSYASTAQTIGINAGYFSSFTIFLALSSPDFANRYLRSVPSELGLFSLGGYLRFWGLTYLVVTAMLWFVPEDPPHLAKLNKSRGEKPSLYNKKNYLHELRSVYSAMFQVLKLSNVQTFVVILLLAKLGFQVNELATNLKLLEKGLSKEDLSITVLIDFPFEIIFGYYAGRWSTGKTPLRPWIFGFAGRLVAAAMAQLVVYFFPEHQPVGTGYFVVIILQHLFGSFMSTIQFVSLCAFHTKIADPAIGGTYMTTLNTLSNYGGTWPKLFIFVLIDKLTLAVCVSGTSYPITSETIKDQCVAGGGSVKVLRDGYYYTNALCIGLGVVILLWVKRKAQYLQALPNSAWRVKNT